MSGRSGRSDSPLRQLADLAGIIPEYVDQTGKERRQTSDATRVALLAAMGVDASTPRRAADALAALRAAPAPLLLPTRVVRAARGRGQAPALSGLKLPLNSRSKFQESQPAAGRRPAGAAGRWRVEVVTETGEHHQAEGAWRARAPRALSLPFNLPLGYHQLRLDITSGGAEESAEQRLIIVPSCCVTPSELLDGRCSFGVIANLYTIRSGENWGIGDFSDLGALAAWAAGRNADFVGVNPLHALLNRGADISPYSPVSRLFRNPIYIDVSAVPDLCDAPDVLRTIAAPEFQTRLAALRESPRVSYEQVMAVKQMALDALYRALDADSDRAHEFRAYTRAGGIALERFATWMAIVDHQRTAGDPNAACDWRRWPAELRDVNSPAVTAFARAHRDRVDFHRWLQFEADRQLGAAADRARRAGMRIGLYQDLAIGSSPSGADTWGNPGLFIHGVSVGAPPDPYSADGQNWGLPPLDPHALAASGYAYFTKLVRSSLRHAGALRIDHAMGLFRLFWIPEGGRGSDGAYVRYPADDLLGIIALESLRHGAVVVGEDLGTVPPEVPSALERWGVLSSKVLYFERDRRGGFTSAKSYKPLALATANTHDMPTLSAFWRGRDIELRREAGLIANHQELAAARHERERDKQLLVARLRKAGALAPDQSPDHGSDLRGAVHEFLCATPSQLVGLSLDDLAGEVEPVNLPGVGPDRFSSWTRKMSRTLAEIAAERDVAASMRCTERGR